MSEQNLPLEPAFHRAARLGDLVELEHLLAQGADINARADIVYEILSGTGPTDRKPVILSQLTALMVACCYGASLETVRWLVERGAALSAMSPQAKSRRPLSVADYAVVWAEPAPDYVARIRYLVEAGLELNQKGDKGHWALKAACQKGASDLLAFLLERGVPLLPPLMPRQCEQRLKESRQHPRRKRADDGDNNQSQGDNYLYYSFEIPLFLAAQSGSAECVQLLLAAGADPNFPEMGGRRPLHNASNGAVTRLLLAAGAELAAVDGFLPDVLDQALEYVSPDLQKLEVAEAFVKAGMSLERQDSCGWARLYRCAFEFEFRLTGSA